MKQSTSRQLFISSGLCSQFSVTCRQLFSRETLIRGRADVEWAQVFLNRSCPGMPLTTWTLPPVLCSGRYARSENSAV